MTIEEKADFFCLLNLSIKDVYSLIEQLLECPRIQTRRMKYRLGKINIKSLLLRVTTLALIIAQKLKIQIQDSGIRMTEEVQRKYFGEE